MFKGLKAQFSSVFKIPDILKAPRRSPEQIRKEIDKLRYKAFSYSIRAQKYQEKSWASSRKHTRKQEIIQEKDERWAGPGRYPNRMYDLEQASRLFNNSELYMERSKRFRERSRKAKLKADKLEKSLPTYRQTRLNRFIGEKS